MPSVAYASGVTVPTEDSAITASQGTIMDADGVGTLSWQWSAATANGGTYTAIASATNAAFTPLQAHVGMFLQVCASFMDMATTPNEEERCLQIGTAVANVNDAPVSQETQLSISNAHTADNPYYFKVGDFHYIDDDGDALASVTFNSAPTKGTVVLAGADVTTYPVTATRAQIEGNMFGFYPEAGQNALITWNLMDDGSDPDTSTNTTDSIFSSLFIGLVVPGPVTATGRPAVAPPTGFTTYPEDTELTARSTGITEPNGINESTIRWIWQQAPAPESGTPADDAWTTISGAPVASATFTPTQANVGNWLRACIFFTDSYTGTEGANDEGGTPEAPTLCSVGTLVTNVNDAPTSDNSSVNVLTTATADAPYVFKASDFPFMDEDDGATLIAITIVTTIASDKGTLRNGTVAVAARTSVTAANMNDGTFVFYPPDNSTATPNFATFTFTVHDGAADSADDYTMTINLVPPGSPPTAQPINHTAMLAGTTALEIPASLFINAYSDPDGDALASVTITSLPAAAEGILRIGSTAVTAGQNLSITSGSFMGGTLTFTPAANATDLQSTMFSFTLSDGFSDSNEETLTLRFGQNIAAAEVNEVAAVFNAATMATAADAIHGAMSASPAANAFDLSLDGTSLAGTARTLRQIEPLSAGHTAWFHSTTAEHEYNAAYNASDNSADSLLHRLQSMAAGDIAMNWQADGSAMRFWARYQSLDLSGNEGETLEYDGSGTGFYIGADRRINERMRLGLAISSDSADITLDLDGDKMDDEATRSATTIYPYLHIDLGNNNQARVIAGFGSGTLDIKSTANSNSTASADLSWNMLAASISHHRPMKGNLSARFDGSLQLGNTSTDETTFSSGSTLMAGKSSANELTINAELRYQKNNITPFASLATRKLGGDLSQSVALDMAFGADLQTSPANLRIAITRQINDTTHQRHSISLDASTNPGASGVTASLGSRYDSITGKPQWQSTIGWQQGRFQTSLQASPGDYRLRARLRW